MRKNTRIMDIIDESPDFIYGTPLAIAIADIRHTTPHIHSGAAEFVFCLKGSVSLICNHENVTLHEGEIFTIYLDDIHCIFSDEENITLIIHLDLNNVDIPTELLSQAYITCEDLGCKEFQLKELEQMKYYLLSVAFSYAKDSFFTVEYAEAASGSIAHYMFEYFDWFSLISQYPPHDNKELIQRFRSIFDYCLCHSTEKLSISRLAEKVHINENYFSQFIKKSPYGNFSLMVGYIRCYKAQTLLLTTDKSIVEISSVCGFSDDKYFYKNFRYWWGMAPTKFREWYSRYMHKPDDIKYFSKEKSVNILASFISEFMASHIFS